MNIRSNLIAKVLIIVAVGPAAQAESFDISWYIVDGGGATFSTGGAYTLGGTLGQPDAGPFTAPMAGGAFELVGGFWPAGGACACLGDMNADGIRNGRDIQKFTQCVTAGGNCACADVNGAGVSLSDVPAFITALLGGNACP